MSKFIKGMQLCEDFFNDCAKPVMSMVSGRFFVDQLHCAEQIQKISFYPQKVKLYLIPSCWESIASEQAFIKRCANGQKM